MTACQQEITIQIKNISKYCSQNKRLKCHKDKTKAEHNNMIQILNLPSLSPNYDVLSLWTVSLVMEGKKVRYLYFLCTTQGMMSLTF